MRHLVPRNLSIGARQESAAAPPADVIGPEEVEYQMTYGKVAGNKLLLNFLHGL